MATVIPNNFEFEGMEASCSVASNGIADVSVVMYVDSESRAVQLVTYGLTCPVGPYLLQSAIFMFGTVNMLIKDKSYEVRLNWRGLARSFDLNDTITTEYKPVGLTEPIATHPYFADFAGNWADRKKDISNPDFDKEGRFVKFHKYLPNGKRNPFAGIENFYQSGLIVADYRVVKDGESEEEDQYDVGKISVPDVEKLPVMFTEGVGIKRRPRNHLLISVELEDLKTGYIGVRREWQTSGPKGWDPDIYEYEDPEEE